MKIHSVLCMMLVSLCMSGCWDTGNGEKIGSVTRLQHTGIFCKTWEGIIQRGGINNGSGVVGGEFYFTVENDDLAQQVQQAMEKQQEVKISYKSELTTFCRSDSGANFLTKIEPLNTVSTPPIQSKAVTIAPLSQNDVLVEILKQNQQMLEEMKKQSENKK